MSRADVARPVPTRSLLVRDIQVLATLDSKLGDIRDAAIYIEGNVIKWVGASSELKQEHTKADEVISLPNRVVIPGLINTHHHMFQSLTRCLAQVCHTARIACTKHSNSAAKSADLVGSATVWLAGGMLWSLATPDGKLPTSGKHVTLFVVGTQQGHRQTMIGEINIQYAFNDQRRLTTEHVLSFNVRTMPASTQYSEEAGINGIYNKSKQCLP